MPEHGFFGGLPIGPVRMWLDEPVETSRLGDGTVITSSLGEALWKGEARLEPGHHADLARVESALSKLQRPGESFLAYDRRFNGPIADPGGLILGASAPVLHTVNADNKRIRVSGLPSGYLLTDGDYIGWQYGSPTRYALHRLVTGATASGAGLTPLFEVAPFVRSGFVTGTTAVVLIRPPFKAVLTAVNFGGGRSVITEGGSFQFIQTLR